MKYFKGFLLAVTLYVVHVAWNDHKLLVEHDAFLVRLSSALARSNQ